MQFYLLSQKKKDGFLQNKCSVISHTRIPMAALSGAEMFDGKENL